MMRGATFHPTEAVVLGPLEALSFGAIETAEIWRHTLGILGVIGRGESGQHLGGPVAIIATQPEEGWHAFLFLISMVLVYFNLMMAGFNLIPCVWSDTWTALDQARWRTAGQRLPERLATVLLAVLVGIPWLVVTANDVMRAMARMSG